MASELFTVEASFASLVNLENVVRQLGQRAPVAIRRAVNHTGDKALTQVTRTLSKQTGVKYGAVKKSLVVKRAYDGQPSYTIRSRGGYLSLKEFGPRETSRGVSVAVWGRRQVFPRSFIADKIGGHVFARTSDARLPIKKLWGPALPAEIVKAETAAAFLATVTAELPARVAYEIGALLNGKSPK